jgi:hypothetical protein
MKARSKKAKLAELNAQFIQYGITEQPSYEKYLEIVEESPLTRRHLQSLFLGRWARAMSSLLRYHPNVYEDAKKAHAPKPEPKPKPKVEEKKSFVKKTTSAKPASSSQTKVTKDE